VHVESSSTPLARARRFEVSPERFRQLTIASAAMLVLIVATGATVRLTSSGLGCEHWPGCQPGDPFPDKGYHSYVEFSNRVVAFLTIVVTLAAWVGALWAPSTARRTRVLAGVVFAGTLAQAPLGAITVYYHLNPWLVLSHLLLSLVVLGLGVLVVLEARGRPSGPIPFVIRWGSLGAFVALSVLVFSGTIVTASGPHPGGQDVRRLTHFGDAIWWHVRATAAFGILFLILLGWAWRRGGWARQGSLALLGLLVTQMIVGEVQYRTRLPWWLVLVHVTLAATVWAAAVALVASLWRAEPGPGRAA
jgi:cytochrome c oxidase assembly protein subunit 15